MSCTCAVSECCLSQSEKGIDILSVSNDSRDAILLQIRFIHKVLDRCIFMFDDDAQGSDGDGLSKHWRASSRVIMQLLLLQRLKLS